MLVPAQLHYDAVVVLGETCLGKLQFQFAEHIHRSQNRLGLRSNALRHLDQDAVNLRQFLVQQPHQFIVLFDRLQGLDEHGLPARTGAVDDTLHAPFLFNFYRDHKAFAPDRHQFILHRATFRQPA